MVSNAATSLFVMIKSKFAHPSCCLANIFSNTGHRYHAHPAETRTQSFITIDFQRLIVPCETASMRDISRIVTSLGSDRDISRIGGRLPLVKNATV